VPELEVLKRPPSTLRNVDGGPREVPELEVQERPPSTLRNVGDEPMGGAGARGPRASTINAKKRRRRGPGRCRSWRSGSVHHQR
jgi:hypothetical protein